MQCVFELQALIEAACTNDLFSCNFLAPCSWHLNSRPADCLMLAVEA